MPPESTDPAALWDMLTYAREICNSVGRLPLNRYIADGNLRFATERRIEIIGEAARRVSESFRLAHPDIPWRRIIGLRNILAHGYGEVRQEVMHSIATVHVPELIDLLTPLVPEPPIELENNAINRT